MKDNQLLAEEGILGDKRGFAACQVSGEAQPNRMAGGLGEMQEGCFKASDQTDNKSGDRARLSPLRLA